jgi:hypothetical protein
MAGIWNVNGIYDVNTKNITSKLSFDIGEMFLAKILSMDAKNSEILIRLIDGRQFPAKIDKPLQDVPQSMVMFQVAGLEDGKLELVMVPKKDDSQGSKDSISDAAKSLGLTDDPELHDLLQEMVKHNIPLTRENVGKIKTIIDFKEKINKSPEEADAFIEKYIESKGIDPSSEKAMDIRQNLKSFLNSVKNIDTDSILTLMDNDIELTEDNIESFQKLFDGDAVLYKDIKDMASKLKSAVEEDGNQAFKENGAENVPRQATAQTNTEHVISKALSSVKDFDSLYKQFEELSMADSDTENLRSNDKTTNNSTENKGQSTVIKMNGQEEISKTDKLRNNLKAGAAEDDIKPQEYETASKSEAAKIKTEASMREIKEGINETWSQVKDEISSRTEELKSMIKDIIDVKDKIKPEIFDKVFEAVKENINDFKVFNSLSNQYYYMDVPVKVNDNEYGCRLLIKDERKKDKKIDSKNIKIAASVKTINMGTVNAFIKVSGVNMNVDIKCDESFMGFIDGGKKKLYDELSSIGYNTSINVQKKEEDLDIAGCSDFFDENGPATLDTRV